MKKYVPSNEHLKAYSERKRNHVSLWKTHAEFMNIFPCRNKKVLQEDFWSYFYGEARNICQRYNAFCTEPSIVKVTKSKLSSVSILSDNSANGIFANYNKLDLGYLFRQDNKERPLYYMNAYIQIDNKSMAKKLIDKLRRKFGECIDAY